MTKTSFIMDEIFRAIELLKEYQSTGDEVKFNLAEAYLRQVRHEVKTLEEKASKN